MPLHLQGDQENSILLAALKNTEQQLGSYRIEWQEDKSKPLQEKEQEWEEKESSMKSKLEDLESQEEKEEEEEVVRKTHLVPRSRHRKKD